MKGNATSRVVPVEQQVYRTRLNGRDMVYPEEIAGTTVDLELPDDWCVTEDIRVAARTERGHEQTARRVCAAALLLCWPKAQRAGCPKYTEDIMSYGRAATNFLHGLGANLDDVIRAGNVAIQMAIDAELTEADIARARGNSNPLEDEGSASGSDANDSGDSETGT